MQPNFQASWIPLERDYSHESSGVSTVAGG